MWLSVDSLYLRVNVVILEDYIDVVLKLCEHSGSIT